MASDLRTDWQTPLSLFTRLNEAVGSFAVDAAATKENRLCERFYGPGSIWGEDALSLAKWASPAFCNPPYDDNLLQWLEKFSEQSLLGVTTVALIPAKIETRWWFEGVVEKKADINFLVGRVNFVSPPGEARHFPPRFPSAVVIYGPTAKGRVRWWDWKEEV